jgi:hypothetical protein
MTIRTGRLATDEFAFRYLAPPTDAWQPLDAVESAYQDVAPAPDGGPAIDLAPLLRQLVLGQPPRGSTVERLLGTLLQVHAPATVTPFAGYGVHASYPSPRAYYPLKFSLVDLESECSWQIDMRRMQLNPVGHGDAPRSGVRLAIEVRNDFRIYAPLYNLFRKSLFGLEAGHFLSEFVALARHAGLCVAQRMTVRALRLEVSDTGPGVDISGAFRNHLQFARERSSGRYYQGFFPAPCDFGKAQLKRLTEVIAATIDQVRQRFPFADRMGLKVKLCLRGADGIAPGVYRYAAGELVCLAPDDPVDACERLYNYTNFNFRHVPAIVFLCVDELAYSCSDLEFLEMNIALGFASQQLIHSLHGAALLGRPFRSYDQMGTDQLLRNGADGLRTYYGLLVARNRCEDALGVLR